MRSHVFGTTAFVSLAGLVAAAPASALESYAFGYGDYAVVRSDAETRDAVLADGLVDAPLPGDLLGASRARGGGGFTDLGAQSVAGPDGRMILWRAARTLDPEPEITPAIWTVSLGYFTFWGALLQSPLYSVGLYDRGDQLIADPFVFSVDVNTPSTGYLSSIVADDPRFDGVGSTFVGATLPPAFAYDETIFDDCFALAAGGPIAGFESWTSFCRGYADARNAEINQAAAPEFYVPSLVALYDDCFDAIETLGPALFDPVRNCWNVIGEQSDPVVTASSDGTEDPTAFFFYEDVFSIALLDREIGAVLVAAAEPESFPSVFPAIAPLTPQLDWVLQGPYAQQLDSPDELRIRRQPLSESGRAFFAGAGEDGAALARPGAAVPLPAGAALLLTALAALGPLRGRRGRPQAFAPLASAPLGPSRPPRD